MVVIIIHPRKLGNLVKLNARQPLIIKYDDKRTLKPTSWVDQSAVSNPCSFLLCSIAMDAQ